MEGVSEIDKLKELRGKIIDNLAEIEVQMNINKQRQFRFDNMAQKNIIILKDRKKYYKALKEKVERKISKIK